MRGEVDLAGIGSMLADRTRATMLVELLGGEALSAGELARRAQVQPSAASNHLKRLLEEDLVRATPDGRRRLYRLASDDVATALEALGRIAPARPVSSLKTAKRYEAIREARTCYDHLAGRLGVALTEQLVRRRVLRKLDSSFQLTRSGERWFDEFGVDVDQARAAKRMFAPLCVDLTERRPHLAGALGAALATAAKRRGLVTPHDSSRALRITPAGRRVFAELGL